MISLERAEIWYSKILETADGDRFSEPLRGFLAETMDNTQNSSQIYGYKNHLESLGAANWMQKGHKWPSREDLFKILFFCDVTQRFNRDF